MPILGKAAILIALALSAYGIVASLYGARMRRRELIASGRRAVYAVAFVTTVAFFVLEAAFLTDDFSLQLVAEHSSTTTALFYKATALWSSQEGSLLLWVWLLSLWSSLVLALSHRKLPDLAPYATAVLLGFAGFFLSLMVVFDSPFELLTTPPIEGAGLNPLLRHPSMMFHPPMLYSGYTLATVPFAFGIAALITGKLDSLWVRATRRFALAAWACLGIGILLGARWSYAELGWGGYWAWDPVENAALMPWLVLTAFLHSAMIQEKRGMLRVWNVSLVLASGVLAILGTFLVRSGVISSIHAFGASTLGVPFLVLIAVLSLGSVSLVVWRRESLRSEHKLDSLLSREAIFLLNNLVLVGLCFVVMWGTLFPLISEAFTGKKAAVGPPWFDRYIVPLSLVLVLLSGLGPLIAWRRASFANLRRSLLAPLLAALVTILLLVLSGLVSEALPLTAFAIAAFTVIAVLQEFWRGARARRAIAGEALPVALIVLVRRNRRRYGGYLVHIGIAVLFVGVAASSAFQHVRDVRIRPGQSVDVGGYRFDYVRPTSELANEKVTLGAVLEVSKDDKQVATLRPNRGYYPSLDPGLGTVGRFFNGEATSEIGLRSSFKRDIWTAVQPDLAPLQAMIRTADRKFAKVGPDAEVLLVAAIAERYRRHPPPANFRVIVSPLVSWIWFGGIIIACGALIAIWPVPETALRRVTAAQAARLARELGRA